MTNFYKVLKSWIVEDSSAPYAGEHKAGDVVEVHDDHAGALINSGHIIQTDEKVATPKPEVADDEKKTEEDYSDGSEDEEVADDTNITQDEQNDNI